jgi:hypothetical protein
MSFDQIEIACSGGSVKRRGGTSVGSASDFKLALQERRALRG